MENALQQQLLKTGLASQGATPGAGSSGQRARSRELSRPTADHQCAARRAQPLEAHIPLNDLIRHYALPRWAGDTPYHFIESGRIRHIWVTRHQQRQLADGLAGVVATPRRYEVVPRAVAEQVQEREPHSLRLLHPRKE